jgi:aldose 1-epimerase
MSIIKESFGFTKEGEEAKLFTLKNVHGMSISLTDYGANLVRVLVPDKDGDFKDVVLGYDNVTGYETNSPGYGSFIGRHANRIGGASFELNGVRYSLDKNNGINNLHSGFHGYNKFMYMAEILEDMNSVSVKFTRVSPHMEQGFPGNLNISVTYSLTNEDELVIKYHAVSNEDTIVNLTNHSYFNLRGHDSGSVLEQKVMIMADKFTPTDDSLIPTGEIRDVTKTPMDFRKHKALGQDIGANYRPLQQAGGYDHNYVLNTNRVRAQKIGELLDDKSKRLMEIFTDMPGVQLYTGNFIDGKEKGKNGFVYQKHAGVCFETQFYPDSCNKPEFPSCVLRAGERYESETIYKFSVYSLNS